MNSTIPHYTDTNIAISSSMQLYHLKRMDSSGGTFSRCALVLAGNALLALVQNVELRSTSM